MSRDESLGDITDVVFPFFLASLLQAKFLVHNLVNVSGEFFAGIFALCCIVTTCIILNKMVAIAPQDFKCDPMYNMYENGWILMALAEARRISGCHLATPCQSQNLGRQPQLRNLDNLAGKLKLAQHQQQLVNVGTWLSLFLILLACAVDSFGGYASIEDPMWSWLWFGQAIIKL